jgi:hypothetical protein
VTNGERGSAGDNNQQVAVTGRAGWRFHVPGTGLNAMLGASWFRDHAEEPGLRRAYGPFGYLQLGRVTWLGEADFAERKFDSSPPPGTGETKRRVDELYVSNELTFRVVQGLDVRGTYDFFDQDLDFESGTRARYGLGFEFMPTPFTKVLAMANLWKVDPLPAFPQYLETGDFFQTVFQVHFFY